MAATQGEDMARLPAWLVADAVAEGRLQEVLEAPQPLAARSARYGCRRGR